MPDARVPVAPYAGSAELICIVTPKRLTDETQAYFWTAEWQIGEKEASADIVAGRIHEFEDVEGLIASLESED